MMKEEMNRMKEKKMRTMVNQNLLKVELEDHVKNGTLFSARRTWQIRSHKLDMAGNYPGHSEYETSRSGRIKNTFLCVRSTKISEETPTNRKKENFVNFLNSVMKRRKKTSGTRRQETAWWL